MRRMLKDWGLALLAAAIVYTLASWLKVRVDVPEDAPAFSLTSLEGDALQLADFEGQTVVLNFWASWCGPCRAEVPAFNRFAAEHPEVAVLGLAVQSGGKAEVERAAAQFGIDYPVAIADSISDSYGVSALPTTVVVDGDGRVVAAHAGALSLSALERAALR